MEKKYGILQNRGYCNWDNTGWVGAGEIVEILGIIPNPNYSPTGDRDKKIFAMKSIKSGILLDFSVLMEKTYLDIIIKPVNHTKLLDLICSIL